MTPHKIPPLFYIFLGLFGTVLTLMYFPTLIANMWWVIGAIIVIFIGLYFQRFLAIGIGLGVIAIYFNAPIPYAKPFTDCHYQADIIKANYSTKKQGRVVYLSAKNIHCDGQTLANQKLQFWDNKQQLTGLENQRLTIRSQLTPIYAHLNFYTVDYEKVLIADGIRLTVKKPKIIAMQKQTQPIVWLKNHFSDAIRENLSANNSAIILALVTGNRTAMSPQQKETLQKTGTSHILAISGLHLALIGGIAWLIGQWGWAMSWRLSEKIMPIQAGAVFALFVITIYALLTGFEIPVRRAWIMFSLMIVSWLWLKSLHHSLLFAAIAVILIEPYAVVSVGFYYSFVATFVVLWSARLNYSPLVKILIMQAMINLTLLPITWLVFGKIPLVAFFVNLLIIPWLGFWVLPWAILACLLTLLIPSLANYLWLFVDFSTGAMWQTLQVFADLNLIFSPNFTPLPIAVIIAIGSLLLALIIGKKRFAVGFLVIFLPITLPHNPSLTVADGRYTSAMIDNGKTAILINSGRKYRHINQAEKWHRYLQQNNLTLGEIVLQNDKISRISATAWLLKKYPNAKVITLMDFPTPYENHYCQDFSTDSLQLITEKQGNHCQAQFNWFGQAIGIFDNSSDTDNIILSKSQLRWQGKNYSSRTLGAIQIQYENKKDFSFSYLREDKRFWRITKQ